MYKQITLYKETTLAAEGNETHNYIYSQSLQKALCSFREYLKDTTPSPDSY